MATQIHARHSVWFWLALAAALLFAFLLFSPAVKELVQAATDWAEGVMGEHPVAGAVVFFLFSAISPMMALASSVVLVPPATEAWGKPLTFLLLWGGWMTGVIAAYGIGRLARPLLVRMGYGKKLDEYGELVSKRLKFWAALLFCLAVPSEIPGYLFGGVHYPFLKFVAAIGIAEGVYALAFVIAGEKLLEATPYQFLSWIGALVFVVLGAGLLFRKLKRKSKIRRAA